MRRGLFLGGLAGVGVVARGGAARALAAAGVARGRMAIANNRIFLDLRFEGPKGGALATTWVDTGGGATIVTEPLHRVLGLARTSEFERGFARTDAPRVVAGTVAAHAEQAASFVCEGAVIGWTAEAQAFLNPWIFERVRFDYAAGEYAFGDELRGARIAGAGVSKRSRFPRVDVTIGGRRYGMLVDTGASCSMLSAGVVREIGAAWASRQGAVGYANMGLEQDGDLSMVRVPSLTVAREELRDVLFVTRPRGTFEGYMSTLTDAPIVGALAGNVLRAFTIEVDYRDDAVAMTRTSFAPEAPYDAVPVTLNVGRGHRYSVVSAGIASGLRAGDRVVSVDDAAAERLSFPGVLSRLRGRVGDVRRIVVEREGNERRLDVAVVRVI